MHVQSTVAKKLSVKFEYLNFYGGVKFGGGFGWPKKIRKIFGAQKFFC